MERLLPVLVVTFSLVTAALYFASVAWVIIRLDEKSEVSGDHTNKEADARQPSREH